MASCKFSVSFKFKMLILQTIVCKSHHLLIIHFVQEIKTFTYIILSLCCLCNYEKSLTSQCSHCSRLRIFICFNCSHEIHLRTYNSLIFKVICYTTSIIYGIYNHSGFLRFQIICLSCRISCGEIFLDQAFLA